MKHNLPFYILIFIIIAYMYTYRVWIFNFSTLTHADWQLQHLETLKQFLNFPYIWSPTSMGVIDIGISFFPFNLASALLAMLNIPYGFIERFIFMWPIIILCPLGSYILIKKIFNNTTAAIIGVLVYTFNTYFSLIKTGHLTLMMSYSLTPFIIYFYQKTLEEKNIRYALITSLMAFVASYYEFRGFYILCIILFLYYVYYTLIIDKARRLNQFLNLSFYAGLPIILALIFNSYWILGLGKVGAITSNPFFERGLFGNEFVNINYAITLFHPFWTDKEPAEFIIQNLPFYLWLIPVFAFLGLYLHRKNRDVLFFGIVAILGIFLTKQVAQPFSGIYPWFYENFPGFNAFREASKFYFLIALGYSVLIAGFVDWIWRNWKKKGIQTYGKYFLTFVIAFIFLWNTKPLITGEIGTLFVPRTIPADYLVVKDLILKQDNYFRTLWIPTYSRWSIYTNNHPELSAVNLINAEWNTFIRNKRNENVTEAKLMRNVLNLSFSNNLLDASSVKYVIVPLRDTANDDDFFVHYGNDREFYINALDELDYLKRIDIGTEEIAVYENADFRPHIYSTTTQEQISKNIPYSQVRHEMINPTEYRVKLENVKNPLYLNFSESFHPQWKVRVGEFNWFHVLINKNYFLPDDNHFKNEAQLNSFYIKPEEICQNFSCRKNSDSSFDMDMTLYFAPQSYMYLGGIISGSTGYLGWYMTRNKQRTKKGS
jgi:hypothetical protein